MQPPVHQPPQSMGDLLTRGLSNRAAWVLRLLALLTLAALTGACTLQPQAAAHPSTLQPQAAAEQETVQQPTVDGDYYAGIVQVKFHDRYRIRLRQGDLHDLSGQAPQASLADLLAATQAGRWARAHEVDEATLDTLRARGEANTGEPLVDVNNYYHFFLPPEWDTAQAIATLEQSPLVERVLRIPVAIPAAFNFDYLNPGGITGNVATDSYQRYLDPAPDGIDARYAWQGGGGTGSGIGICDIEQDYNPNHADLPPVTLRGPVISFPGQDDSHGTAVLGILAARNNGLGVTGIAYDAQLFFAYGLYNQVNHTQDSFNTPFFLHSAITRCTAALQGPGIGHGVILIEAQIAGPNRPANPAAGDQRGLVPTEWDKAVYDVIGYAVANGITVVEAAGNGRENLDSAAYQTGNGGHYPFLPGNDSGAIIVGAGKSAYWGASARSAHDFTNYGATVDLQGWGDSIVTTGYGTLYPGGDNPSVAEKNQWYARSFGGTSGASPIVTGAVAVAQSTYKQINGSYMTPAQVRALLRNTGTPQTGTKNIGPLPDLRAAIEKIYSDAGKGVNAARPAISPPGGLHEMPVQVTIGYGQGQTPSNTVLRYTLDGSEPTLDSTPIFPNQNGTLYLLQTTPVKVKAFQYDPVTQRRFESPTTYQVYSAASDMPGAKVETPQIAPIAGTFQQPHQVTITTATPGATIRYRTDGRDPSTAYPGTLYTGPITLNQGSYQITARAYKDGLYDSDVARSGPIVVNSLTLPPPTITPNGGTFNGGVTVQLATTIPGATIRYSLDGEPDQNSPIYAEPIQILPEAMTVVKTLRARVFLDGYTPSPSAQATFTLIAQAEPPTITPNGGNSTSQVLVSMSTPSAGGVIRYTTNGSDPTSVSPQYTGPFNLGPGVHTVKARTFLLGAAPSTVTAATFTVYQPDQAQVAAPRVIPPGGNHTISVTVRMESDTEGAAIYYTISTAGEPPEPTQGDSLYDPANPPVLTANANDYILRAKAFKAGLTPSDTARVVMRVFNAVNTVITPTISPPGGVYTAPIQVKINIQQNPPHTVPTFFYTTDGSEPFVPAITPGDTQVTLNLSKDTRVKALGAQLGWYNSPIVDETYTFVCAAPTITPGGVYTEPVQVSIATTTPDATIHYTTDGSEPDPSSPVYTTPIDAGVGSMTVRAKCYRDDFDPSPTLVETFIVQPPPVGPTITQQPVDQEVNSSASVTFSVAATGTPTPTIQWQFNGVDIAGATDPLLVLHGVGPENEGEYRAIVVNPGGTATSASAHLSVVDDGDPDDGDPDDGDPDDGDPDGGDPDDGDPSDTDSKIYLPSLLTP